jgi:hypothetical protein
VDSQRTQIRFWMNFCCRHQCPALRHTALKRITKLPLEKLRAKTGFLHFILPRFGARRPGCRERLRCCRPFLLIRPNLLSGALRCLGSRVYSNAVSNYLSL